MGGGKMAAEALSYDPLLRLIGLIFLGRIRLVDRGVGPADPRIALYIFFYLRLSVPVCHVYVLAGGSLICLYPDRQLVS